MNIGNRYNCVQINLHDSKPMEQDEVMKQIQNLQSTNQYSFALIGLLTKMLIKTKKENKELKQKLTECR